MNCLVRQPGGLGDILWTMQIAMMFHKKGFDVVWPVPDAYKCLNEYLDTPIKFVPLDSDFAHKDIWYSDPKEPIMVKNPMMAYLPLQRMSVEGHTIMAGKYEAMGLSHLSHKWKECIHINRNIEKEKELKKILGAEGEYAFVNDTIGTPPDMITFDQPMKVGECSHIVKARLVEGYNVFDWIGVLMGAKEIHTPDTSFSWLCELFKPTAKLFMYPRSFAIEQDLSSESVRNYLKLDWEFRGFPNG
jgi:hypothetical protein